MSLLSAETPDLLEALGLVGIDVLYHPSLSSTTRAEHEALLRDIEAGTRPLDILCVEGAVLRGPGGTGAYDAGTCRSRKDRVATLARRARFVVAVGTCAAYGGIPAEGGVEATGLQFHKAARGGFLGADFVSGAGRPVVNLPGCPAHPSVIVGTLAALVGGEPLPLDPSGAPEEWYGVLVHQGCVRNEYHEYRVEETEFGQSGCLFFHLGCRAPMTHGPCNKLRWNRRSSKTAVGVPCFGCTSPDFPRPYPLFRSRDIAGVPIDLPEGVDRAHYLAYKSMAAAAAPQRLKTRKTRI